jgi:hypothetical protein
MRAPSRSSSIDLESAAAISSAPSRESTQPIGVRASAAFSSSTEPDTISRSTARVIAT